MSTVAGGVELPNHQWSRLFSHSTIYGLAGHPLCTYSFAHAHKNCVGVAESHFSVLAAIFTHPFSFLSLP